jgi:hypothetical protein
MIEVSVNADSHGETVDEAALLVLLSLAKSYVSAGISEIDAVAKRIAR